MNNFQIITAWVAVFECQFDIVVDALRDLLTRIQAREIRPLVFGFVEIGEGFRSTSIEFQEKQHEGGMIFVLFRVNYNQKTGKRVETAIGVFIIYKNNDVRTRVSLQCTLADLDETVEIANHFAREAYGHGVNVEVRSLPTDK